MKLNQDVQDLIVQLVRNGNYIETAAAAAGISEQLVRTWMSKGCDPEAEPYASFRTAVLKAEAEKEAEVLARINDAGQSPEFWQANAWILSRRHSKRWQEKVLVEVNNELEKMLTHLEERLDHETYTKVLEALADNTQRTIRRPVVEIAGAGARALPAGDPAANKRS